MPGRGQRGRPGAVPRARLGRSRMEFGAVGRMRGLSGGRCRVCLGPGIIYPVPSLVHIPTVFAMNSSILAGAGLTSSTSPAGGCARASPPGWSCLWQRCRMRLPPLIPTSSSSEEPPSPLYPSRWIVPIQQGFGPARGILSQHHHRATGTDPVPVPAGLSRHGTHLRLGSAASPISSSPK